MAITILQYCFVVFMALAIRILASAVTMIWWEIYKAYKEYKKNNIFPKREEDHTHRCCPYCGPRLAAIRLPPLCCQCNGHAFEE